MVTNICKVNNIHICIQICHLVFEMKYIHVLHMINPRQFATFSIHLIITLVISEQT